MTDAGWAERKVEQATTGYSWNARIRKSTVILPSIAAKLLLAEHQRAVRIVKRAIAAQKRNIELTLQRGHENNGRLHVFALAQLEAILAALERGRTTRRKG